MDTTHISSAQIINFLTLGQVVLIISLCLIQQNRVSSDKFLAGLVACIGILLLPSLSKLTAMTLSFQAISLLIGLPALLLTGPLLWFYVLALTSPTPWRLTPDNGKHLILACLGALISFLTGLLPNDVLIPLLKTGEVPANTYIEMLMIIAFALIMGWTVQSGYYLVRVFKRLKTYRLLLKHHFANNDHRELYWLNALVAIINLSWTVAALSLLVDNLTRYQSIGELGGAIIALLIIWLLAVFGLRQSPGFAGRYIQSESANRGSEETEAGKNQKGNGKQVSEKYQRSALDKEQSERIAGKIEHLMQEQDWYLNPDVSLTKLANTLGTSSNYVSQTMNETMECSFFDYINRWRINAAKPMIIDNKQSVLDVAMAVGFNARSSFYNAFKQHTGMTPSEFRKQHSGT